MNSGSFGIVIFSALVAAVVGSVVTLAVAASNTMQSTAAPAAGMTDAQVQKLLAEQEAKLRKEFAAQIKETVSAAPVVIEKPVETVAQSAAQPVGEVNDEQAAALAKRIDEVEAHLMAVEGRFQEYENNEAKRLEQLARDRMESGARQMGEQLMQRAPEMIERFSTGAIDRMKEQLELDDVQAEEMQKLIGGSWQKVAESWDKVRKGEMTQEEARAQMEQMQKDTDTEMQRILRPDQYEKLQQNGGGMGMPRIPGMGGRGNRGNRGGSNGGNNNQGQGNDGNRERGF